MGLLGAGCPAETFGIKDERHRLWEFFAQFTRHTAEPKVVTQRKAVHGWESAEFFTILSERAVGAQNGGIFLIG